VPDRRTESRAQALSLRPGRRTAHWAAPAPAAADARAIPSPPQPHAQQPSMRALAPNSPADLIASIETGLYCKLDGGGSVAHRQL